MGRHASLFVAWVGRISAFFGIVAAVMLALSMLVVCHLVFVRYALGISTIWQTELVTYLLISATLVGSPYVLMVKGHVRVDVLPQYLPEAARRKLDLVSALLGLVFSAVLFGSGALLFWDALAGGWRSDTVWAVPLWLPYLGLPVAFLLMILQYVADLLRGSPAAGVEPEPSPEKFS